MIVSHLPPPVRRSCSGHTFEALMYANASDIVQSEHPRPPNSACISGARVYALITIPIMPAATQPKTRSSTSQAARAVPHRRSGRAGTAAEREERMVYRAAAIAAARQKRPQAPLCDHKLARSIQYRTGNQNDGRFIGIVRNILPPSSLSTC